MPAAQAAAPPGRPDLARFYAQRIEWEDCADEMAQLLVVERGDVFVPGHAARSECGRVEVPRDYAHPNGSAGTATIAMLRLKATDPKHRLGSLVLNFGGPGQSGVTALNSLAESFSRLNTRYDLVAHDPRGVRGSDPVFCEPPLDSGAPVDQTPDTRAEAVQVADAQRAHNARCKNKDALAVLPWVGTADSARDLDVIRAALGDDSLSYLGFSYGTKLGAAYLHQFPGKAGRLVLDGVDDPTLDARGIALANSRAFQEALENFLTDCVHRGARECPLGATRAAAEKKVETLFNALDRQSLTTDAGLLDQSAFIRGVEESLYNQAGGWPHLRTALTGLAVEHDGSALVELAGGRTGNGIGSGNGIGRTVVTADDPVQASDAQRAVTCRDTNDRPTAQDYVDTVSQAVKASPVFGKSLAAGMLQCTGWPVTGDTRTLPVDAASAPPALLVATRGDPATPYEGAAHMAAALGNHSRVLTYEGEGHGAYLTSSACVHEHVERFLTTKTLPPENATCT
ncbi:alpha/beta hydrolase [Streptomyces sp. NBC_00162]|uniref:alpha/beta hydrolase n=1 Tax=Streptomyces sp. NBC_00162 TaxID=2903629 RepID=UPI00214BB510|nr:alpha/beta fold hydrolase [Streptomyces sp. NBC_00162]UUU38251.1 alpha/beta fold hydrolase [Streptomyces sp. NBC_00162]